MIRTLPQSFPLITPNEALAGYAFKASIVRRLAQAQNYLWANMRNVWAGFGYEGNGRVAANRLVDPATSSLVIPGQVTTPGGRTGMPVASFIVPKNWASGTRLRVTCYITATLSAKGSGFIEVQLFDMNGAPVGTPGLESDNGTNSRLDVLVDVPQSYGQLQAVIYVSDTFAVNGSVGNQQTELLSYSVRYINRTGDVFGVTPEAWQTYQNVGLPGFVAGGPYAGSLFYMKMIHNTLALWSSQNPHICHGQLKDHWQNLNAYKEVGRWVIQVPYGCTARFDFAERRVVAANAWRILVDGVSVASGSIGHTAGTAQSEQNGTFSLAAGERVVTIEFNAGASASSAQYGAQLLRFKLIEESRPTTTPAPASSYVPIDEEELQGDKPIRLTEILHHLQENDRWLYANRRMVFIADYVARTLKAFGFDTNDLKTDARTAYTTHPRIDLPYSANRSGWRNITNSRGTLGNDEANTPAPPAIINDGVTPDDVQFGGAGTGYSTGAFTGLWYWPDSGSWVVTGRVLFFQRADSAVLAGTRRRRVLARARRKRPDVFVSDDEADGRFSPWGRDSSYHNRAYLDIDPNGGTRVKKYLNTYPDWEPHWYDAGTLDYIGAGGYLKIIGRVPPSGPLPGGIAERPEGMLFETELMGVCILDEPFTQMELNQLPENLLLEEGSMLLLENGLGLLTEG